MLHYARKLMAWLGARPVGFDLLLVLLIAALPRLAFLFRAPPFYVGGDSPTYLQPAVDLLRGAGFDPIVKRPPGYPLFLALTLAGLGLDLQGVNFAQHLLGIATAGGAWALGRVTFGRAAGIIAGMLVALNGPLIIFEHYIMAESLFTALATFSLLAIVLAARRPTARRLLVVGLLLGLASATRQTAEALFLLVPLALLVSGRGWSGAVRGSLLALGGFAIIAAPWLGFDYLRHQTVSSATLGETLIWRLTRSGPENEFFRWKLTPVADAREQEARKFAFGQAADRVLPSDTKVAVQTRFGLDESQADRLMRSLAQEAILQQPGRYVTSSFGLLLDHLLGQEQWLGGQGKSGGVTRYSDVESKYSGWWSEQTRPLIQNASPAQEDEFRRALALGTLFQPYQFGWPLLALFAIGLVASFVVPARRQGLIVGLAALIMLLLVAFLAGGLPRYRYPSDPALAVLEAGGLVWLVGLGRGLGQRASGRAFRLAAPGTASLQPGAPPS